MTGNLTEKDLYMLFNMAFDGLEKIDLSQAANETELEDIENYLRINEDAPQVAVIQTRDKLFPKALLFRKIVKGKAVLFVFWKRGTVCEGMAASLDGVSVLNEFIWVQDVVTNTYRASLKPKIDATQRKDRQAMMTRAAVNTVVVEPLNRKEYKDKFNGDILKKLRAERAQILENMKLRGLVPLDAVDPENRTEAAQVSADIMFTSKGQEPVKKSDLVTVQKGNTMTFVTQITSEHLSDKLVKELEREARLADREEEKESQAKH